jgi:hypothetical protein
MKKAFKLIGIAILLAAIVFSMAACDDGNGTGGGNTTGGSSNLSLNGVWSRQDGLVISIVGSNGYFTVLIGDWPRVEANGDIKIGSMKFRNITSAGNNRWSAQEQLYNGSSLSVGWHDSTITLSSDGYTFTSVNELGQSYTYTRQR